MSDDLIKRAEEAAAHAPNRDLLFALAARIRELEAAQGVGYTGEIEPGMRFVWEHGNPHAECEIMVTEVRERQSDERAIYSIANDAKQPVWNDESRFREAVRPAPVTVSEAARERVARAIFAANSGEHWTWNGAHESVRMQAFHMADAALSELEAAQGVAVKPLPPVSAQLIGELLMRHGSSAAPTSHANIGQYQEILIPDGPDHTIRVFVEREGPLFQRHAALRALAGQGGE